MNNKLFNIVDNCEKCAHVFNNLEQLMISGRIVVLSVYSLKFTGKSIIVTVIVKAIFTLFT